jgi:hypothetical protein
VDVPEHDFRVVTPEGQSECARFRDGFVITHGRVRRPYSADLLNRNARRRSGES